MHMTTYGMHSFQWVTAEEAAKQIGSHQRVFVQGAAMTPHVLVEAMVERAEELRDVEVVHLHTEGSAPYSHPSHEASFRVNSFSSTGALRPPLMPTLYSILQTSTLGDIESEFL